MTAVIESYIEIDENHVAWIADTRIKVIEIALDKLAHGSSPGGTGLKSVNWLRRRRTHLSGGDCEN